MKKHVFMILAHNNPEYLNRMVSMLDAPNHFFIVHIDKKNELLLEHSAITLLKEKKNCTVFSEVSVNWGGLTQVLATLALVRKALNSEDHYDYFHLISGCDLPLVSATEMDRMVENDSIKGYVGLVEMDWSGLRKLSSRYRLFHFNDFADRRNHNLKTILCRSIEMAEKVFSKIGVYPRCDLKMPVYKGSQWWSLSRDVICYVDDFLKDHPKYIKRFQWTSCIDEIFFHTIVFNSPFASVIEKNNHRYIDWRKLSKKDKPPRILTEDAIPEIEKGCFWFARKTDPKKSELLIKYFEEKVKG
ncbi:MULTISPECIES: beta-1,6-N-acetylglucosaminyltransferase [unclassified Fibrobacter]|uniref:beta-1,6-N-acetylglucosaminyltransferase n=1 Tax=unclassified Fibrobacter TaxID=2634177 RepID=UPI000920CF45|nr:MULTISPECIES: beta-1,6-N-acetylglucosaminyltransferase [unclassified Fibrobacter]OWV02731.1 hypothetical protein B7993_14785 [Fibrobacter sp. UWH3]SHK73410.1 Core-2/I-Branching enzyme [Fibrobacter sp. UWH6]